MPPSPDAVSFAARRHLRHLSCLFPSRNLLRGAAAVLLLAASAGAVAGTWFVRTDGGDPTQCTGRVDAAYPGTGRDQPCAWQSMHHALPVSGPARIAGGDTVLVAPGSYMIGWGAPGASGGRCYAGGPYDCYLAPVPSGPDASRRTRILGQDCAAPPKLWGTERVSTVLNLEGSSFVEVGCLEVTDQDDCVEHHRDPLARCRRDSAPYGQWASVGISARDSTGVLLRDLDIHGLANRGVLAGGLRDWTLERVRINANGWAGWDGDIGARGSNAGAIVLRGVEIAWNGCGERWRTRAPWACWAQTLGGYGDGLGTGTTGGQWLVEDSHIHHNTSDGLDLLYLDGQPGTSLTVRRVRAEGNAGNQLKSRGATLVENSVVVGNCTFFDGRDGMAGADQRRALGNAISLALVAGQGATVRHNTITGQGDCLLLSEGGGADSTLEVSNNAFIGAVDWRGDALGETGELACGLLHYNAPGPVRYAGNLFWNVKQGQCPGDSVCGRDPAIADRGFAGFDPMPLPGSPLLDRAAPSAVALDFFGGARPGGGANDIGAVELHAPPAGGCVRARPGLAVPDPVSASPAGEARSHALRLRNNDSAGCAATRFVLTHALPAGWSGHFGSSVLVLSPGTVATASLVLTPPRGARAGSQAVPVAAGSAAGAVHAVAVDVAARVITMEAAAAPGCGDAGRRRGERGASARAPGGDALLPGWGVQGCRGVPAVE